MRTDQQIIDQTNELARKLYEIRGYVVREGHRFDKGTHPHEFEAWRGACAAQEMLTDTCPDCALDNLRDGEDDEPSQDFTGENSPLNWKWNSPEEPK